MVNNIQMTAFNCHTYENLDAFPEFEINARVLLCTQKKVSTIDVKKLKQLVLEAIQNSIELYSTQVQK